MRTADSKPILLDVNVLLALAWPNHQFHAAALQRLKKGKQRWATCALTQLSFIRLSSNPAAFPNAKSPSEAAALLAAMTNDPLHVYFAGLAAPTEARWMRIFQRIVGHQQVTDAYLLRLASRHHAVFLTFDARLKALAATVVEIEILTA